MSNQKRRRNRKGGSSAPAKGNQNAKGGRKPRKEPAVDATEFWGDPDALPEPIARIDAVPDVKAVVSSLGRPPVTGHETVAEHWFSLVYERAAVLAGALAAAGELSGEPDDEA